MSIRGKRVYEPRKNHDDSRVLVARIWPRGLSRKTAGIDHWIKDVASSTVLREWFARDTEKWPEFSRRYFRELRGPGSVRQLRASVISGTATPLFAGKDVKFSNVVALKRYLERLAAVH